ncbi:MAG: ATP synthase F1 subunit delta [Clostridia bacterium]|nr:ATP synthase F1 subunit delta [Clostridia bacterium]
MTATSNNFAEALFMLASEENAIDIFYTDLKLANDAITQNPEYIELLAAPSISKAHRKSSINTVFGANVCEHILSFLCILCEKGKIAELPIIFTEYEKLREWASNTAEAVVVSAVALSEQQMQNLIKALQKRTGKRINLKTVIDKSVLGGLTVTLDGEVIDGSVKTNLKRVREVIS